MTLHRLRACLCVVFAQVGVIGSTKADGTLLAFMAHIDSYQHGLVRDFLAKRHSPKISTEFSIHLSDDIQEDTVIVLLDGSVGDELRDDRTVTVDLVLQEGVEVLVVGVVWHDNEEYEI